MRQVRSIIPYGHTPLVEAMYKAKKDFSPKFDGLKTMVVLTDGADNLFKNTSKLHALHNTADIPTFLEKEFRDSKIQVNVVLFEVNDADRQEAEAHFGRMKHWPLPGHLLDARKDTQKLFDYLNEAMHPQLYCRLFDNKCRAVEPPAKGLPVTRAGESNPVWFPRRLLSSSYLAQVHSEFRQNVQLDFGDFLLLQLCQGPNGPVFKRRLYAKEAVNENNPKKASLRDRWILAVLQNQLQHRARLEGPELNLMLTLENQAELAPRGDILMQVRPTFIWLQLKGDRLPQVRWGNLEHYPAPAWEMTAEDWPDKTSPIVSAWWTQSDLSAYRLDPLVRDVKKPLSQDFRVTRDDYQIESVTVEEHDVDGVPKPCLVVRARFAKDKPILVQSDQFKYRSPTGGNSFGYEHRYYTEANKYMGIIYPVTAGDVAQPFTLDIIALDRFKAEAEEKGTAIEDWQLPEAKDRYQRPPAVPVQPATAGD
jgi:hypothetical protein